MDDAKHQLVERLKSANNILVTVSRNPSVDQLAACVGLALLLNKEGKHVAAVFSGQVPSTLEFLKPEDTLEKNTDSLRDFIIALDKSKADKLRYKVEDNVVRIFITPYKTSISQSDLEFSQGDFNVDLVVALGVSIQEDLDEAITAHGRILHDATVASVNISNHGQLGSINWQDPQASSLSELMTELALEMGSNLLDEQISTAFLTGIVSATSRFSNDRTSSQTMSASAALMGAGANQQLVASKLEEPLPAAPAASTGSQPEAPDQGESPDGTIEIEHTNSTDEPEEKHDDLELPAPDEAEADSLPPQNSNLVKSTGPKIISHPPSLGGTLTANTSVEKLEPSTDPFSLPKSEPPQLFERRSTEQIAPPKPLDPTSLPEPAMASLPPATVPDPVPPTPVPEPVAAPAADAPDDDNLASPPLPDDRTSMSLSDLEEEIKKSEAASTSSLDAVRDEVSKALNSSPTETPMPIAALNAQPLGDELHPVATPVTPTPSDESVKPAPDLTDDPAAKVVDPAAPPPVPPPIPFQFGKP